VDELDEQFFFMFCRVSNVGHDMKFDTSHCAIDMHD
jgi:hypothetical protein